MIGSVNYLMTAFEKAHGEYEWTEFLWELVIDWRSYEQNPDLDPDMLQSTRIAVVEMLGMAIAEKRFNDLSKDSRNPRWVTPGECKGH
jgi:hypothetical protein